MARVIRGSQGGRQFRLVMPPVLRDHTSDHLIEGVRLAMKAAIC